MPWPHHRVHPGQQDIHDRPYIECPVWMSSDPPQPRTLSFRFHVPCRHRLFWLDYYSSCSCSFFYARREMKNWIQLEHELVAGVAASMEYGCGDAAPVEYDSVVNPIQLEWGSIVKTCFRSFLRKFLTWQNRKMPRMVLETPNSVLEYQFCYWFRYSRI